MFEVRQSTIPDAGLGLFAAREVKAPIVLCYGGTLVDAHASLTPQQQRYAMKWIARSKKIISMPFESGIEIGWLAAMANEPLRFSSKKPVDYHELPTINRANCSFGECESGVFLIVCSDLSEFFSVCFAISHPYQRRR